MRGRVVSHAQVVRAGQALFRRTGGLDMDELAREVCVSRATLYRVVRSRDLLLGDVLWSTGQATMRWALEATPGTGVDRVVGVARAFNERVVADPALRTLLAQDPATAFRVLFSPEARVHARFVELWTGFLGDALERGEISATLPLDELAYVFVRVGESVLYGDLLSGRRPDLAVAETVQRSLLSGAPQEAARS